MNTKCIACSIDDNYIEQFIVFLTSIFQNNSKQSFHIYVLNEHLSAKNKKIINDFFLKHLSNSFGLITIDSSLLDGIVVFGHVTRATYYRILLAKLLPIDLSKVLYLDVDIIVRGKIDNLWDIDIDAFSHIAVENIGIDDSYKLNLGLSSNSTYFNAGVLMINLDFWRLNNVYESCIQFINTNPEKIILWDQDVLNYVLENKWKEITYEYNAQEAIFRSDSDSGLLKKYSESYYNPKIIHFTGGGHSKPWYRECRHILKNEYSFYLYKSKISRDSDIWIRIFGVDFKLSILTLPLFYLGRMYHKLH